MRPPTATYRLQLRGGMDFAAAAAVVPYLRDLGVSHLYASPLFAATAGSTHGYDVVDHNVIDPALGGRAGFERLSDALRAAGLGLILDIVPNHMAASTENPWWASVLRWGSASPFAGHFDIDWSRRLTLPVLGRPYGAALAAGELALGCDAAAGGPVLRYFDHALPLAPASWPRLASALDHPLARRLAGLAERVAPGDDAGLRDAVQALLSPPGGEDLDVALAAASADAGLVDAVHAAQPWRLMFWKEARRTLSYRRFFEVTGLVGVRVEDEAVFAEVHRTILALVREGRVDGLRVDHVDGLADPAGYLRRLRRAVGPDVHLVVEKILCEGEHLPRDWPVDGTTGYEFVDATADLLADADGVAALSRAYRTATGAPSTEDERRAAKQAIATVNFEGEVTALVGLLAALPGAGRFALEALRRALVALLVAMPAYRIYATGAAASGQDRAVLGRAKADAGKAEAGLDEAALAFLHDVLIGDAPAARGAPGETLRRRFGQLAGPVMAKGVEDTLFYRDHRFIAFNEVGSDPGRPAPDLARFHAAMAARSAAAPHALTATATHDTKRGEDARARLMALSEAAGEWTAALERWRQRARAHVSDLAAGAAPEAAVQWLIPQALAGGWPVAGMAGFGETVDGFRPRFRAYLEKALREAKQRTSWTQVDADYEAAVLRYAQALFDDPAFREELETLLARLAPAGWCNGLAQTTVKLTAPGVPDIYQGSEAADFSLVDPDNRRPVDFARLAAMLAGEPAEGDRAAVKQRLVARLLALRRAEPALFSRGDYQPLAVEGPLRAHLAAFARSAGDRLLLVAVPRHVLNLLDGEGRVPAVRWHGTELVLPAAAARARLRDVLAPRERPAASRLAVADLLAPQGVAVWLGIAGGA